MRRRRLLTRQAVALSGVLLTAASCSFLYDLDQVQCEIPKDCAGFEEWDGKTKVSCVEGVCAVIDLGTGGTGNTTAPSTTSPTSTTGTAGSGGTPECLENDDCIELAQGNPALCRDEECIDLYTDECPIVLGAGDDLEYLRAPKVPLIFGAYAGMGVTVPENTAITANYEYAIDEVNRYSGGGAKIGNDRYPFVAVVCDEGGDLAVSMEHLTKTLKVPAIISAIGEAETLLEVFEAPEYGAKENNVFMMSPFGADSTLTNQDVDPNGLMWHLLGEAADKGLAYKPLVARAEAYLRAQQDIPPEEPIRVAMVVADMRYLFDIADVITETVEFNGMSVIDNEQADPPNFMRTSIESYNEHPEPDLGTAYNDLMTFEPHLVLAIASHEFVLPGMMDALESAWGPSGKTLPPPFYLFSPQISRNGTQALATTFEDPPQGAPATPEYIPLRKRILTVSTAGAEDTRLYDRYFQGFEPKYRFLKTDMITLEGTENFYDAAYYTMYAIHGSMAINNITGLNVASGMRRLVGGPTRLEIGSGNVETIIGLMRNSSQSITFETTMGLPNFNGAGSRTSLPGINCIDLAPGGIDNAMEFFSGVLRYDAETEELIGDDPRSIVGFMEEP